MSVVLLGDVNNGTKKIGTLIGKRLHLPTLECGVWKDGRSIRRRVVEERMH